MAMNDYNDYDDTFEDDADAPEESNNRTFLFIAGGLGVLVLCALLVVGGYILINSTSNQTNEATAQAQATMGALTVEAGLTGTAAAQAQTQAVEATTTAQPTNTPVVAEATMTLTETPNPATATVGAAFTQIAASTQTIFPTTTALPNTGFTDDVGLPGMFVLALALIIVIFLVRRLRAVPAR